MRTNTKNLLWFNAVLISIVLVLMPFHAFSVTVLGYALGHKEVFSAWKEALLLILLISSVWYWWNNKKSLPLDVVNVSVFVIIALSLLVSIFNKDWHMAFLVGIKTNVVPLVLLLCAQISTVWFSNKRIERIIFIPAVVVVILALIQPYIFHPTFLQSIGYGSPSSTGVILAGQYIESAASTVRAFSTLGGPNQLGAYLLVPTLVAATYLVSKRTWQYLLLTIFFTAGIYVSYSRSALVGFVCGLLVLVGLQLPKNIRALSFGIVGILVTMFILLLLLPSRCVIANVLPKSLIHGSCETGQIAGSDLQRVQSQQSGLTAIIVRPLGYGLGSAGPSSFYSAKPLITENWYLQIGIELGLVGLIAYIVFFIGLGKEFYLQAISNIKDNMWPAAGLAILVSVAVASMFLHTWADSTLALIGMAIFGIVKGRKS